MAVKVRQRNGKWWVFIDYHNKRKAKCIGTSKRAAQQVAEKIQARLTLGQFEIAEEKARRPFDAYFRSWLDTYVTAHCKASTRAGYDTAFRVYLLPAFGQKDITEITREDVKKLAYDMLAQGKSRSYVKATLAPLSEMFNHAIEDGHCATNPALRILRRSRQEDGEQRARFLTREEVALLLETCRHHFPASYPFVLCLVRTGMRIGEAVALQWGDIDFHSRFAEVRRNYVDGTLTTPKSGKGRRVDLSVHLTDTLKALLLERKKETLQKGWGEVPPWVFTSEVGTMMDPDNFRKRVWPKLLAKAGLRQVRIHDLRHTFASLLIQNGESLAYVKEQMGHHSIKTTVDTYGHLMPGGNKAAVDRLDDLEHATIRNLSATSSPNTVLGSRVSP
jgi:integrase